MRAPASVLNWRLSVIAVILVCLPVIAQADSYTFGLLPPSGAVFGLPGTTVGWGYEIGNLSPNYWLVITGLIPGSFDHVVVYPSDPTDPGYVSPIFDFPILAPGSVSVNVPFDGLNGGLGTQGLFQITWENDAPSGFVNAGDFTISAEWYDGDPFNGGNPVDPSIIDPAPDMSANYSATVTTQSTAPIPEPSTLLMVMPALVALGVAVRKRRP